MDCLGAVLGPVRYTGSGAALTGSTSSLRGRFQKQENETLEEPSPWVAAAASIAPPISSKTANPNKPGLLKLELPAGPGTGQEPPGSLGFPRSTAGFHLGISEASLTFTRILTNESVGIS